MLFPEDIKKTYTADEFLEMSDFEGRYELIDGEIYDMSPSPNLIHQDIAGGMYTAVRDYIRTNRGKCKVYIAPSDVRLNNKVVLQPDVYVVCDSSKLENGKRCNGAPDWVIEVLSPSSERHDMYTKLRLYKTAGVREYWMIDPEEERVIVYPFADDKTIRFYTFDDDIPVGIYRDCDPPLVLHIRDIL